MELNRRGFIGSLIAFTAVAPAIVRSVSIMPVRVPITMRPLVVVDATPLAVPLKSMWQLVGMDHQIGQKSNRLISKLRLVETIFVDREPALLPRASVLPKDKVHSVELKHFPEVVQGLFGPPVVDYLRPAEVVVEVDTSVALQYHPYELGQFVELPTI